MLIRKRFHKSYKLLQLATLEHIWGCTNIDHMWRTKQDFDNSKHRIGHKLAGSQAHTIFATGKIDKVKYLEPWLAHVEDRCF